MTLSAEMKAKAPPAKFLDTIFWNPRSGEFFYFLAAVTLSAEMMAKAPPAKLLDTIFWNPRFVSRAAICSGSANYFRFFLGPTNTGTLKIICCCCI